MSSRKIEDLNQSFQPMVRQLLELGNKAIQDTGWLFFITDGFRSFEEQTKLYAQGRTKPGNIVTNAMAGESPHNYGFAVDCAFQKNGVLSYDATLYAKIYPIARNLGFELGADWIGFKDKPHFEHPKWEVLSEKENQGMSLDTIKVEKKDWERARKAMDILEAVHKELKLEGDHIDNGSGVYIVEINYLYKRIDQLKELESQNITSLNGLPKSYNGKKIIGVMIEP